MKIFTRNERESEGEREKGRNGEREREGEKVGIIKNNYGRESLSLISFKGCIPE